jgi:hypothetical protein
LTTEGVVSDVEPVVRVMLLCDEVGHDPDNPLKINVFGLVSTIRSLAEPPFPLCHPQLCAYLQLTGGRGTGQGQIATIHADTDQMAFTSATSALTFGSDPLAVLGVVFRMRDCPFPESGLYWVRFRYNEKVLAQQPLVVR